MSGAEIRNFAEVRFGVESCRSDRPRVHVRSCGLLGPKPPVRSQPTQVMAVWRPFQLFTVRL